jgi:hypothetical protein
VDTDMPGEAGWCGGHILAGCTRVHLAQAYTGAPQADHRGR